MFERFPATGLTLGLLFGLSSLAHAAIVPGAKLFVIDPNVDITLTFLDGAGAGFNNNLLLAEPGNLAVIFNNHTSGVGTTSNQGRFAANTELVFKLESNPGSIINTFFSGPAARNPDNFIHALVDTGFDVVNGLFSVGFEDQSNGGDQNYLDMVFSINNVRIDAVPLPPAVLLLGSSLFGLAIRLRKRA